MFQLKLAVEAVAVGVFASITVLIVLNRISLGEPLDSVLGKVIIQAVPLSIGASVANAIIARSGRDRIGEDQQSKPVHKRSTMNDLGATVAGGIFISFSIAPTEEIPLLAAGMNYIIFLDGGATSMGMAVYDQDPAKGHLTMDMSFVRP